MNVLPDGSVVLVPHNEFQGSADAIAKATAKDRLEKLMARKQEIDYMATANAVAGTALEPELEVEYKKLCADIEEALRLLK